jgi:hypothetical protein
MKVRLSDFFGQQQTVMLFATRISQRCKRLLAEHFTQRIGRVDRTIDNDVRNVNAL